MFFSCRDNGYFFIYSYLILDKNFPLLGEFVLLISCSFLWVSPFMSFALYGEWIFFLIRRIVSKRKDTRHTRPAGALRCSGETAGC